MDNTEGARQETQGVGDLGTHRLPPWYRLTPTPDTTRCRPGAPKHVLDPLSLPREEGTPWSLLEDPPPKGGK